MSKIKVDSLQSNENLKLVSNGTGVVELKGAGGADATVQLAGGANSKVKIKSPPHSAGQSYTLVLPDSSINQKDFLRVKSVTGSGSTETTQLEYAAVAEPDLNNLNASNLTSGTIDAARFPSTFPTSQAALELVAKLAPSSAGVSSMLQSVSQGTYWIIGKNWTGAMGGYNYPYLGVKNGNNHMYQYYATHYNGTGGNNETNWTSHGTTIPLSIITDTYNFVFNMYFFNKKQPGLMLRGNAAGKVDSGYEVKSFTYENNLATHLNFYIPSQTTYDKTEILIYKFKE